MRTQKPIRRRTGKIHYEVSVKGMEALMKSGEAMVCCRDEVNELMRQLSSQYLKLFVFETFLIPIES